jgi:hypothetical protein
MKTKSRSNAEKAHPVHQIRHGAVSGSIWRQETDKGPLFNATFQRAYKDGDDWKYTGSFGRKDLLVLGLIAARAFEWIAGQSKSRSGQEAQPSAPAPSDDVPY